MRKCIIFDLDGTLVKLPIRYDIVQKKLKELFKTESNFSPLISSIIERSNGNSSMINNAFELICAEELIASESLEEIDREPWMKKVLKNELDVYIDSDNDMIEMNLKVVMQEEKVNYLDSVMRHLNNRGYLIRQMIDWAKFTHG